MRGPTTEPCGGVYRSFRPARYVSLFLGLMPLRGPGRFSRLLGVHTGAMLLLIVVVGFLAPYYMVKQDAAQHRPANRTTPDNSSSSYMDTSQSIAIIVLNPILISSMGIAAWSTALFKTSRLLPSLLEKLHHTDSLLKTSPQLHRQHFKFTLVMFTAFVCAALAYLFYFSQKGAKAKQVIFSVGILIVEACKAASFCTDLQFATLCYFVKMRFQQINSNLKSYCRPELVDNQYGGIKNITSNLTLVKDTSIKQLNYNDFTRNENLNGQHLGPRHHQGNFITTKRPRLNPVFKYQKVKLVESLASKQRAEKDVPLCDALETLRAGHQQLCDVIDGLNALYGPHTLVSMSGSFANGLLNLYFALYGFTSSNGSVGNGVTSVWGRESDQTIGSLALTGYYVSRFLVLTLTASSTVNEIHRTSSLLSALSHRHLDTEAKEELQIFFCHVTSRCPIFSACGFFNLDMSLITSALAAWSTYLVIMAQLHESK